MNSSKRVNVDLPVTIISVGLIFSFVTLMALKPQATLDFVNQAFNITTSSMGSILLVFTFTTVVLSFYLALGKYGDIKLGEGKPEYSMFSYIAMMALAALASAAMYWSFTEWASYYVAPALGIEPYSTAAAELSLGYAFFHWGLATQGPYVVVGVAIAYAVYIKKVPFMKVSTVCEEMMGGFKHKSLLGKIIDIVVIFSIVGGLGCTLGLAVPLVGAGLKQVLGIEMSFPLQVGIVIFIGAVFTFTSFIGTKKGMKRLSDVSSGMAICFLIYVLFAGPTTFIMKNIVSSMGWMIDQYPRMSFFTDPVENGGFPEGWTIFFQAFALNYTALMGIFIAKISKGRTIKEVALACLFGVSGGVWFLFGINGSFAMEAELTGKAKVSELVASGVGQDSIFRVIELLPGGVIFLPVIILIITVGFVASSLDTASFSLSQTVAKKLDAEGNVSPMLRMFWCGILTLVPLSIMFANAGFSALKILSILISVPFMFVVIFMEIVLFKWLNEHKKNEEKNRNKSSVEEVV